MPKRRKVIFFLVWPLAISLWAIGWSLCWIGSRKQSVSQKSEVKYEELVFTVMQPEKKLAV